MTKKLSPNAGAIAVSLKNNLIVNEAITGQIAY